MKNKYKYVLIILLLLLIQSCTNNTKIEIQNKIDAKSSEKNDEVIKNNDSEINNSIMISSPSWGWYTWDTNNSSFR